MTTKEIADRLVAHCRKCEWEAAQKELYAADAVSIEQQETPAFPRETKGQKAIIEKGHKFDGMVETMHSIEVSEPLVADDAFAMRMQVDMTMKGQGRMKSSEVCVYEVKDGKIVSERFFS